MKQSLTFDDLQFANLQRSGKFKALGSTVLSHPNGLTNWSIAEWTNALAGEAGEACNIAKKIVRGDFNSNNELGLGLLLDEIGDVIIYADLICSYCDRQTSIVVVNKFNAKSEELGLDITI